MKTIKKILIILGIILIIAGGVLSVSNLLKANSIVKYDGNNNTNKQVLLSGSLIKDLNAKDDLLDIEVDSPVLIRNVSMVQWFKDEKGTRLVLANYPLESFEADGKEYNNPEFPSELTNEVFVGSGHIDNLQLGPNALKALANLKQTPINELPEDNGNKYNLTYIDGAYVTASDEWELGDIKVTYFYTDDNDLKDISVLSKIIAQDNTYILDSEESVVYDHLADLKEIRTENMGNMLPSYALLGVGVLVIIIGLMIKNNNK